MAEKWPIDNLTPYLNSLSPEEKRDICRRAGKESVRKKAEKKKLADYLLAVLQSKTETGDVATDVAISLVREAANGNVSAFQTIRDTIGEKVPDNIKLETSGTIHITIGDDNE